MSKTIYIAWTGQDPDRTFDTLAEAEDFMRSEGLEPTGESASDGFIEHECRALWDGYCDFWVKAGRTLDLYGDGYEPRIRVLHKVRGYGDADED